MDTLPLEIFEDIILLALDVHPVPHAVARVNSVWADVALPLLHARIFLWSPRRLRLFSASQDALRCSLRGREVEVRLPGGTEGVGVWALIVAALRRCQHTSCCRGVRVLRFCLNSHLNDPDVHLVKYALQLVNPEMFIWTGPDPDHNFSTAIVPTATRELCAALPSWSSLTHLELANISFLNVRPQALVQQHNPSLRKIIIRQAVFLLPSDVLGFAVGLPALEEVWLVDVYVDSIWGLRLRRADVETLLVDLDTERVHEVIRFAARTERLIGGDREV